MRKHACFAIVLLLALTLPSLLSGWVEDGYQITYASYGQRYPQIAYTGNGCAIICWEDDRNYLTEDTNIYAQRIDTSGVQYWIFNGMPVCRALGAQETPSVCPDGSGGAYICWVDSRDGNLDVYLQRIDSDGLPLWDLNGVTVTTDTQDQYEPVVMPDGSGGVIIVWTDGRYVMTSGYNVYAQRFDSNGNRLWNAGGNAVCDFDHYQGEPKAVSDGEGGVFVVWRDGRHGGTGDPNSLYMARMSSNGVKVYEDYLILWDYSQTDPVIVPVGDGSYIVAWMDYRFPSQAPDLYAQRVSAGGTRMWSDDGAPICDIEGTQYIYGGVSDGDGGAIFLWHDTRNPSVDIYAGLIDSSAAQPWGVNGIPVCLEDFTQLYADAVSDNAGGAVICWEDRRSGSDVYAQRIDHDGTLLWPQDGKVICGEGSDQLYPVLCSDGANGALITWMDGRLGNWEIYASLVTGSGDLVATLLQSNSAIIEDEGILLAWNLSEIDDDVRFIVSRADAPAWLYEPMEDLQIVRDGLSFSCTDGSIEPGAEYRYTVEAEMDDARILLFQTEILTVPAAALTLHQNHPNPFNPSTTISYYLPESCPVTLEIYDVSGRLVRRLLDREMKESGLHGTAWDGHDAKGNRVQSGLYFYRIEAGKRTLSKKMVLLR
jgi:hypothetical protein